jgi:hypothetical protein
MKTKKTINSVRKSFILIMICLVTMGFHSMAQANDEWNFGLGTGFFGLNLDGTVGMDLTTIDTAVEIDIDMSSSDVGDIMETAYGLGGYATNGTWLIDYSVHYLKLEGDESFSTGNVSRIDLQYENSGFEIMVGYPVLKNSNIVVSLHGGVRYTSHESEISVIRLGTTYTKNIDEDWVDALIGLSANIPVAEKWMWNNRITAGFGGSEGTYSAFSGLSWQFHKNWSTSLYGKYTAVEFENSTKGDADWYLYDVDEYGAGINILFHW